MKGIFKLFAAMLTAVSAVCFNGIMGATLSVVAFDGSAVSGAVAGIAIAVCAGAFLPAGLCEGVLTEIWTGEMIRAFRIAPEQLGWYDRIRSYDQYVNNDVIHFTELGGDPEVLINNNTYPIPVVTVEDADKPISLDKYDTKATSVSDDELYAVSYDKMQSVIERHREAIKDARVKKALHAIAPDSDTAGEAVVIRTSGEVVTAEKRKRMIPADLIALKARFDKMKMPASGRILVLNSDHVNDLLLTDSKFKDAYNINQTEGKIARLYGFDIYEMVDTPLYTSTGNKKEYGASAAANDRAASVAFYLDGMMKASGSVNMYYSEASKDPEYHRNLINFRNWSICLPLKAKQTRGAIVSSVES